MSTIDFLIIKYTFNHGVLTTSKVRLLFNGIQIMPHNKRTEALDATIIFIQNHRYKIDI
jgi:hypothetical protein